MTYSVKIMGTKYNCELIFENNVWYLRLMLNGSIEDQIIVKEISRRGIENSIIQLLDRINIEINDIQQKRIISDLTKQAFHLFNQGTDEPEVKLDIGPQSPKSNPFMVQNQLVKEFREKVSDYKQEPAKVEKHKVSDRINEMENESSLKELVEDLIESRTNMETMIISLEKRVEKLEEMSNTLIQLTESILEGKPKDN